MRQMTRIVAASALVGVALCVGGCVVDEPSRPAIHKPEDLRPDLMVIGIQPLIDDDNNGYPDTIPLIIYLWDERYPLPLWVDGSMHFEMVDEAGKLLAEWDVPEDVVKASRSRDQVGAVHHMVLDLRDAMSDEVPVTNVRLRGQFIDDKGEKADTKRPIGFQIGG